MNRELVKIFLVRYLGSFLSFIVPLFYLVWRSIGLSDAERISLLGYMSLSLALCEPLSGLISDGLGRKFSFTLAGLIFACALGITQMGTSFEMFLIAEILLAFGYSLITGADVAILYETMEKYGKADRFPIIHSWLRVSDLALGAAFSAAGGILADSYGMQIPFAIGIIGILGMSMASMTLRETLPKRFSLEGMTVKNMKQVCEDLLHVARIPGLRALFVLDALLMTVWIVGDTLLKPLLQKVGSSNTLFGHYSAAGMLLLGVGLLIGGYAFSKVTSVKIILAAIIAGTSAMIVTPLFSTAVAVVILLILPLAKGLGWAVNSMVISQKVPTNLRASSFSAVMVISRISVWGAIALILRIYGKDSVAEFPIDTIQHAFVATGFVGMLILGGLLLFFRPYRS